jgi:hypothetical protein
MQNKLAVRIAVAAHIILIVLEVAARIHDIQSFGISMFKYYTIDSNILQMIVSAVIVYLLCRKGPVIPSWLSTLHLVSAVCLTVTFLIALLVLAPQEGFAYYFLQNVAPINHFLGPLLSVLTFLFMERPERLPGRAVFAPMAATLLYGVIMLILNILRVIDGPYFFLQVYKVSPGTVVMWFCIIAALCLVLSGLYLWIRRKVTTAG